MKKEMYFGGKKIDKSSTMFRESLGIAFSFGQMINRKLHLSYPQTGCRAYLGDNIFYKKVHNFKSTSFVPFRYKKDVDFLNKGKSYVVISMEKNQVDIFKENLSWLHAKEEISGVVKSKLHTTIFPNVFIIEGDKRWKDSCWKYMLYSFYIKCMCSKNPKHIDIEYWRYLDPHEEKLLKNIKMKPEEEVFDPRVYDTNLNRSIHDREGFVSICSGKNIPMSDKLGLGIKEDAGSWPRVNHNYDPKKKAWRVLYSLPEDDPKAWQRNLW